jgi:hypothetical protein
MRMKTDDGSGNWGYLALEKHHSISEGVGMLQYNV